MPLQLDVDHALVAALVELVRPLAVPMTVGIVNRTGVVHRLTRPQGAYTASCGEPCLTRAVVVTPAQVLVYHLPRCIACIPGKAEFDRWLYREAA